MSMSAPPKCPSMGIATGGGAVTGAGGCDQALVCSGGTLRGAAAEPGTRPRLMEVGGVGGGVSLVPVVVFRGLDDLAVAHQVPGSCATQRLEARSAAPILFGVVVGVVAVAVAVHDRV